MSWETVPATSRRPPRPNKRRSIWIKLFTVLSIVILLIIALTLSGSVITYFWIASQLPSAEELRLRSHQFATTQILDREGNVLWEIVDPRGGRRTNVGLNQISRHLINATLSTEDRFFYLNVGVDPIAVVRAVYANVNEGEVVSGASTITQQLARDVFLTPEERTERSLARKVKEAVLAIEINRHYSKDQILEVYFNQIYYGNLAYGIEAASQTYLGKSASALTLAEAAMLAGLPQSPAIYDPYISPEKAKTRQEVVLDLMVEAQYITPAEAEKAAAVPLEFRDANFFLGAPHFVTFVRQELERTVPPAFIYQAGLQVHTTLDPRLQAIAEREVKAQVEALADQQVTNGALVALDVANGQVLAMVGSKDFRDASIDGQVNMVVSPRQPGSTIKPLTYLAAFESLNWTPSQLIMDVPIEYPEEDGTVYRPTNVDHQFHGLVLVREALANSYNIPALKTLEAVGLEALKEMAARLGISTLTAENYGLSLTLGSGEVSLLEMTSAYQAIANRGQLVQPTSILHITDNFGRVIEPVRPSPRPVLQEEHAYLITDILADNEARTPGFGPDSPLNLSRPAAAKTGTTNDFRDNWTIGYTPDIVAGVWVGNADNSPMIEVGGATGAAPIWHNFMEQTHALLPGQDFVRPPGIVEWEICADSGTIPSEVCPETKTEIFFQEQPPLGPEHDIHQLIQIDLHTGLLVNRYCQGNISQRYYRVFPPEGREWALSQGIEQPPTQECPSKDIVADFIAPSDNSAVRGTIALEGTAFTTNFSSYQIELGTGTNPETFAVIQAPLSQMVDHDLLGHFDTTQLENGPYTLRLVVFDKTGGFTTDQVRILVDNPSALISLQTPVMTPPPLPTPQATEIPEIRPEDIRGGFSTQRQIFTNSAPISETPTVLPR